MYVSTAYDLLVTTGNDLLVTMGIDSSVPVLTSSLAVTRPG